MQTHPDTERMGYLVVSAAKDAADRRALDAFEARLFAAAVQSTVARGAAVLHSLLSRMAP